MPSGVPRIPSPHEWLLTKVCSRCGEEKPWAKFPPRKYWPDGSIRVVASHCHACDSRLSVERQKSWAKDDPRKKAFDDRRREWTRSKRRAIRQDRIGYGVKLSLAPFAGWLRDVEREEGTLQHLSRDAGLHEDTLATILRRNKGVAETTIEAALCARGLRIDDIYTDTEAVA